MEGSVRTLTLLHTADLHSRVWPFRSRISRFEAELGLGEASSLAEVGGLARLATLLAAERERGPTLWLDSGDALEGAEVFRRSGGHVELELLSALGLSAMALGNHELSLGGEDLAELLATSARFPVLAANLEPRPGSELDGRLAASALFDVAGLQVGVVGAANPNSPPNLASAGNPWRLALQSDLAAAVQAAVDDLTPRAELVVLLSHLGLDEDHALVASTTGIDLVLGGHQHVLTAEPEWQDDCSGAELREARGCSPRRVPIVHSGAYGRWLSRVELELTPDPSQMGAFEVANVALKHLPNTASVPPEPRVEQYLEQRRPPPQPPLAFLPAALHRRSALGGDSALGNLTVDAVQAATAADVVLVNSSGLRADLEAGPLLRSDLVLAFPFDEPWRLIWLSGRRLRRGLDRAAARSAQRGCESALQVAGLELQIHCAACAAEGDGCLEIERLGPRGGVALADDAWLLVALPAYVTLPGGDFADLGEGGAEVAEGAADLLARRLATGPSLGESSACARELRRWSTFRCEEAFGNVACPLSAEAARAVCRSLPVVEGGRDGRIQMWP
ncbi:MAG: 5'-nucleotidase C-terminal domain-containing protein [Myxococcales bacterium]